MYVKNLDLLNINKFISLILNIFQNFKVTIAIHLEALKLFVKGATYIKKPKKPKNFFSEGNN